MNNTHKLKVTNKYLSKLKIQLARLKNQTEGYGGDCPAKLILIESRLKENIYRLEKGIYENSRTN